jgi:hypothetical protein
VWALTAFIVIPARLIRHLFGVLILFLATGIVLGLGMQYLLGSLLGLAHDSNLYQTMMMLTVLVVILVGLRALFQPLILQYGGAAARSARHLCPLAAPDAGAETDRAGPCAGVSRKARAVPAR